MSWNYAFKKAETDSFLKLKYNCTFVNLLHKTILTNNLILLVLLNLREVKRQHDTVVRLKAISQKSHIQEY